MRRALFFEWLSGNSRPGLYGSLFYALFMSPMLKMAPYGPTAVYSTHRTLICAAPWSMARLTRWVLLIVVSALCLVFEVALTAVLFLTVAETVIEEVVKVLITLASFGTVIPLGFRSCFESFIDKVEAISPLWQRSRVIVDVAVAACTHHSAKIGCREGACYERSYPYPFLTVLKVFCPCIRDKADRVKQELLHLPHSGHIYDDGDVIVEKLYPGMQSTISDILRGSCTGISYSRHRPIYDTNRLMWIESEYRENVRKKMDTQFDYKTSRGGLDEELIRYVDNEQIELSELCSWSDRVFATQYAAGLGRGLSLGTVLVAKLAAAVASLLVGVIALINESENWKIALSITVLGIALGCISSIRDRYDLDEILDMPARGTRVLDIEVLSTGAFRGKFGEAGTSWSLWTGTGSGQIEPLTWVENLIGNRSIATEGNPGTMICLSRVGTTMALADVISSGGILHAGNWRTIRRDDVRTAVNLLGKRCLTSRIG